MASLTPSFYAPVPAVPPDDVLRDYRHFLERRNGAADERGRFAHRETWLNEAAASPVRYAGRVDEDAFARQYVQFQGASSSSAAQTVLLAFVKMNAGEAYGVEVLTKLRHNRPVTTTFDELERLLAQEETYHTRILLGATRQFGVAEPTGAWRPPLPLKVLIGALAHAPASAFHPILLGAEIAGVFTFSWMLRKVGEVFRDQPAFRETLEQRLIEVLVDEMGHIAFNRLAVGPVGLKAAKSLAALSARGNSQTTPEFRALGWSSEVTDAIGRFDYADLPEEVRRRSFFV
jgi:hypothetical protein